MEVLKFNNNDYVIYDVKLIQSNNKYKNFRYFTAVKVLTKPSKWIDKVEYYRWKHIFIEIQTNKIFYVEVDYYDNQIDVNYIN